MSNMDVVKPFVNKLEEQGYQRIYEEKDKVVYQNQDYKITIKNERCNKQNIRLLTRRNYGRSFWEIFKIYYSR